MSRYKFQCDHYSINNDSKPQVTTIKDFDADTLCDIIEEFREFLLGVGFSQKLISEYLEVYE